MIAELHQRVVEVDRGEDLRAWWARVRQQLDRRPEAAGRVQLLQERGEAAKVHGEGKPRGPPLHPSVKDEGKQQEPILSQGTTKIY